MGRPGQAPPSAQPDPNHPLSRPPPGPGDLRWCGPNPRRPGAAEREPTHAQRPLVEEARSIIEGLSAITLATHDMSRAVRFYQALGFELLHGGETSSFTSFRAGVSYLNLIAQPMDRVWSWWGRVIVHVGDVDAAHERALAAGYRPTNPPRDAEWGERYFHLTDPDGHELSFARPLPPHA